MSILVYHMVDSRFDWGATRTNPRQFKNHIRFLIERGYTFQTLSEYLRSENPEPGCKRICITFDDAYESVFRFASPIMHEYDIPATVFVITGYVGRFNTWDVNLGWLRFRHLNWSQIKELTQRGWEIGSHSISHPDLTQLDLATLISEVKISKKILERKTGAQITCFAYPFGRGNRDVAKTVEQMAYICAVTMNGRIDSVPSHYNLPRQGIYLFDTLATLKQKVEGKAKFFHQNIQKVIGTCSKGSVVFKKYIKRH